MGLYEKALGHVIIPVLTILLLCLAFVPARRQLNSIIIRVAEAKININGVNFRILPAIAMINFFCFYNELQRINRLSKLDD